MGLFPIKIFDLRPRRVVELPVQVRQRDTRGSSRSRGDPRITFSPRSRSRPRGGDPRITFSSSGRLRNRDRSSRRGDPRITFSSPDRHRGRSRSHGRGDPRITFSSPDRGRDRSRGRSKSRSGKGGKEEKSKSKTDDARKTKSGDKEKSRSTKSVVSKDAYEKYKAHHAKQEEYRRILSADYKDRQVFDADFEDRRRYEDEVDEEIRYYEELSRMREDRLRWAKENADRQEEDCHRIRGVNFDPSRRRAEHQARHRLFQDDKWGYGRGQEDHDPRGRRREPDTQHVPRQRDGRRQKDWYDY